MYSKLMPMDKETPSRIIKEIIGGNYCRSFIFENKEFNISLMMKRHSPNLFLGFGGTFLCPFSGNYPFAYLTDIREEGWSVDDQPLISSFILPLQTLQDFSAGLHSTPFLQIHSRRDTEVPRLTQME